MNMPPMAPAMPPKPTTEPTARFGNMSEASVKMLADHPWCAGGGQADQRDRGPQRSTPSARRRSARTHSAQISIAVLRAAFTVQPRLMKRDESQPPPMLPMSAIR